MEEALIPKRAIFCWCSDKPMSWLRQQSIESFKRHNPDWKVDLHTNSVYPQGEGFRYDVIRSDYARYVALQQGGMYFDTDILFVKPIPEQWLCCSTAAPLSNTREIEHIACLAGNGKTDYWHAVERMCHKRIDLSDVVPLDCQALGVKLLRKLAVPVGMFPIPVESFLTHSWSNIEHLWSSLPYTIQDWVVGIHWYGGDRLSQDMEELFSEDVLKMPDCFIKRVLTDEPACLPS